METKQIFGYPVVYVEPIKRLNIKEIKLVNLWRRYVEFRLVRKSE